MPDTSGRVSSAERMKHRVAVTPYTVYVVRCKRGCATEEYRSEEAANEAAHQHQVDWGVDDDD